jgi:hypothetical protein
MRKGLELATVGAMVVLTLMTTPGFASGASRARVTSAKCSRAEAQTALRAHPNFDPVYIPKLEFPSQVLCGAFLGPGSRTMVVGFAANVCAFSGDTVLGWGVYRWRAGKWQRAWKSWTPSVGIAAVGTNIKETVPIPLPGDPCSNPRGGTKTRTWHWNGSRFVASAWTTIPPPVPSNPSEFRVRLAGGGLGCAVNEEGRTLCQGVPTTPEGREPLEQIAKLQSDGQVTSCTEYYAKEVISCFAGNLGDPIPYLSPGQQTTVGPFTCKVRTAGVECTVTATGKGFLITPESVTKVGG